MTLEGTATVPVVGKVKKAYVAVALAGTAGIVGFAWWRRSQTASDTAPDYYADTRTGSELPTDDYTNPGGVDTSQDDDGTWKAPKSDVEWSQAVVEKLSWFEPGYVSRTVGKYLAGSMLTADEADLIREAWAQVGKPPGNQRIVTSPTPTTPTPGTPGPKPPPGPVARTAAPKLHHVQRTSVSLTLLWDPVSGAKSYTAYCNGGGQRRTKTGIVGTSYTFAGLKPGTQHSVSVASVNSAGVRSGTTSNVVTLDTAGK